MHVLLSARHDVVDIVHALPGIGYQARKACLVGYNACPIGHKAWLIRRKACLFEPKS